MPDVIQKPTKPSPKVGDRVRLTGVVLDDPYEDSRVLTISVDGAEDSPRGRVVVAPEHLEIIRQPFKRGEEVFEREVPHDAMSWTVTSDEDTGGTFYVVQSNLEGVQVQMRLADEFERRP